MKTHPTHGPINQFTARYVNNVVFFGEYRVSDSLLVVLLNRYRTLHARN